jgi:hypothetical protein
MKLKFYTLPELFMFLYFFSFQFCSHLLPTSAKEPKVALPETHKTRDLRTLNCSDQCCFRNNHCTLICNSIKKKWLLTNLEFPSAKVGYGRVALVCNYKIFLFLNILKKFQPSQGHSKLEMHTIHISIWLHGFPSQQNFTLTIITEFRLTHNALHKIWGFQSGVC